MIRIFRNPHHRRRTLSARQPTRFIGCRFHLSMLSRRERKTSSGHIEVGGCGHFLGDDHAAVPWLCLYCTGLIQPGDCLMRSWSCQSRCPTTCAAVIGVVKYKSTARSRSSGPDIRKSFRPVSKKTSTAPHRRIRADRTGHADRLLVGLHDARADGMLWRRGWRIVRRAGARCLCRRRC